MSGGPYNSVLRSGLTRRVWLVVAIAMLIPVSLAMFTRWFEAEERRATLQSQELVALSRDKASAFLFNGRVIPHDFASGLEGRYFVLLDDSGAARFSSAPVPDELVLLFGQRVSHALDAPGGTTILAWYAAGREWRGAMTHVPAGDSMAAGTVVAFAPEAPFGSTFVALVQLMDNFRVFEPIVGFSAEANATSLSWLIYNDLTGDSQQFGSAGATSVLTIIGVVILLSPVLVRTWREFKHKAV